MSSGAPAPTGPVTQLLDAAAAGDAHARERLWVLVYDELRRTARHQLAGKRRDPNLQTTVLVHEAYLRLVGDGQVHWDNRRHFFASAARAMRHICVDDARSKARLKRGGPGLQRQDPDSVDARDGATDALPSGPRTAGPSHVDLGGVAVFDRDPSELLALDEALSRLEQLHPDEAEIVLLRYFAGLTVEETALALGLAPRTVDKRWLFARAWLHRELNRP